MSDINPKKMKVAELKAELEARGLDAKGNKDILIDRLEKALATTASASKSNGSSSTASSSASTPPKTSSSSASTPSKAAVAPSVTPSSSSSSSSTTTKTTPASTPSTTATSTSSSSTTAVASTLKSPASSGVDSNPGESKVIKLAAEAALTPEIEKELEARKKRAEKFGTEVQLTEAEKAKIRAARFTSGDASTAPIATTSTNNGNNASTKRASPVTSAGAAINDPAEAERLAKRAKKFGMPTPPSSAATNVKPSGFSAEDEAKRQARLAKFGTLSQ